MAPCFGMEPLHLTDNLDRLCRLIDDADPGGPWAHFLYAKADRLVCELTEAGVLTSHLEADGRRW